MENGEWVTVKEYSEVMGLSSQRIYQKIWTHQLKSILISELARTDYEAFKKIGRGPSNSCSTLVWLDDEDTGGT